jgi:hypothetical protein
LHTFFLLVADDTARKWWKALFTDLNSQSLIFEIPWEAFVMSVSKQLNIPDNIKSFAAIKSLIGGKKNQ